MPSPQLQARLTGLIYLAYFLTAIGGSVLLKPIIVSGNPAATAANIGAQEPRFQLGFSAGLISIALYIALTARFYELFRPVNRNLSLLAALFSLTGCAIKRSVASSRRPRSS